MTLSTGVKAESRHAWHFLLLRAIGRRYRRYVKNRWYALNSIVEHAALQSDGLLRLDLVNGIALVDRETTLPHDDEHFNCALQHRVSRILYPQRYRQLYLRVYQEFVLNQHLRFARVRTGDVVVDAGANIGAFVVNAARRVGPQGRVIAFEPDADNLRILERNVQLNELENVLVFPKALWSKAGAFDLERSEWPGLHRLGRESKSEPFALHGIDASVVDADTLDNVLSEVGVTTIDVLKMDIEGAEVEALRGAAGILSRGGVTVMVEAGHVVNGIRTWRDVTSVLREYGFSVTRPIKKHQFMVVGRR